jgi:LuxR family transcriptional regulator, quorum-sensing system regulator SdiA
VTEATQEQMLKALGLSGYYIALRVKFAFPASEFNNWPKDWVKHYGDHNLMLDDPLIRWAYSNTEAARWSALGVDDPKGVLKQAAAFGLRYGVAVSIKDQGAAERSFAFFARKDREFFNEEVQFFTRYLADLHDEHAAPELTKAELDALRLVADGKRLKQVGHELGVTEGAIKQRLKTARLKLNAQTGTQAATKARSLGLI